MILVTAPKIAMVFLDLSDMRLASLIKLLVISSLLQLVDPRVNHVSPMQGRRETGWIIFYFSCNSLLFNLRPKQDKLCFF